MRFLFYSHDGLGLGHTRRNLAIAAALTELEPRASVLLATGADFVSRLGLPSHLDILKLPGLRKVTNGHYCARHLRLPVGEIRSLRAELLLAAVKSFAPAVVLVDKHAFGAGGEFQTAGRMRDVFGKFLRLWKKPLKRKEHGALTRRTTLRCAGDRRCARGCRRPSRPAFRPA